MEAHEPAARLRPPFPGLVHSLLPPFASASAAIPPRPAVENRPPSELQLPACPARAHRPTARPPPAAAPAGTCSPCAAPPRPRHREAAAGRPQHGAHRGGKRRPRRERRLGRGWRSSAEGERSWGRAAGGAGPSRWRLRGPGPSPAAPGQPGAGQVRNELRGKRGICRGSAAKPGRGSRLRAGGAPYRGPYFFINVSVFRQGLLCEVCEAVLLLMRFLCRLK